MIQTTLTSFVKITKPTSDLKQRIKMETVAPVRPVRSSPAKRRKPKVDPEAQVLQLQSKKIVKRKLKVQIYSEDEDDENSNATLNTSTCSSPDRSNVTLVSVNRPDTLSQSNLEISTQSLSPSTSFNASPTQMDCKRRKLLVDLDSGESDTNDVEGTLNFHNVKITTEFAEKALSSEHLKALLSKYDIAAVTNFLESNKICKYTCLKLFTYIRDWYNVFRFAKKIKLELSTGEVYKLYNNLKDYNFVETDYMSSDLRELLERLELDAVREIFRSFRLSKKPVSKKVMIDMLMQNCKKQSTLTVSKSTEQVLRDLVKKKLGFCIKISDSFYRTLYKVHMLNTYANGDFSDPRDYFNNVGWLNVVFPTYEMEECPVFHSEVEFSRYVDAIVFRCEYEKALEKKNIEEAFRHCNAAFGMLKQLRFDGVTHQPKHPHLDRFSASHVCVSTLTSSLKHLTTSHHLDQVMWLAFLLHHEKSSHARAIWHCHLAHIQTFYLKDHQAAAHTMILALEQEREHFSEVQLQDLADRCRKLLKVKSYNLDQAIRHKLTALSPPLCDRDWPSIVIERNSIRSEQATGKRVYVSGVVDGTKSYGSVEEVALGHYSSCGYPSGIHCEGSLIGAAFALLFWDIIYETPVPGAFVSPVQRVPLDMYTRHFYKNREEAIERRLQEVREDWDDEALSEFITDKFTKNAKVSGVCRMDAAVEDPTKMLGIILCIGRRVVAKILERLAKHYRESTAGFPDLMVWNVETKSAKFVEVKGEGDKLSLKQKLWLNYLLDIGAKAEVCHVHSIGSKKTKKLETIEQSAAWL